MYDFALALHFPWRRHAEAEIVRAREAAKQMMELSNQIQHMFNLCEVQ